MTTKNQDYLTSIRTSPASCLVDHHLDIVSKIAHKSHYQPSTSLYHFCRDACGDVVKATRTIASGLGMMNDFPAFMAVMDVAWFRPDLVDPASPVPTGVGAVAFLDILQRHLGLATHEEAAARMIELQARRTEGNREIPSDRNQKRESLI